MSMLKLTPEQTAGKKRFFHRARTRAPVAVCWDVFTDHERMGEFTETPARIVEPGHPERNGLGCVRRLEALGMRVDELVNYWKPNELFGYHVIASPIVTHHQGIVRFWSLPDGGTEWVYDMQLVPSKDVLASTPNLVQWLRDGFHNYMGCLECECERRAAAFQVPPEPIALSIRGGQLER
ncbi:MAG TPA: hypothetical protein VJM11_03165 [Nevskiaceae bacterium]|nr:hypothetical protein [Nevskiaceae bacterium]